MVIKFKKKWLNEIVDVGSISIDLFVNMYHEYINENVKTSSNEDIIDISLLRYLCNILENSLEKSHVIDTKINKKQIVINEYCQIKPSANQPQTKEVIDKIVEDLHNTGQIKKMKLKTKLYYKFQKFLFSKK